MKSLANQEESIYKSELRDKSPITSEIGQERDFSADFFKAFSLCGEYRGTMQTRADIFPHSFGGNYRIQP